MSSRQMRRLRAVLQNNTDTDSSSSGEEFEPNHMQETRNIYKDLKHGLLRLHSHDDEALSLFCPEDTDESQQGGLSLSKQLSVMNMATSKKTNKKKKQKQNKKKTESMQHDDEVERAVAEVNQLLGAPPPAQPPQSAPPPSLLLINVKHLNPRVELTRLLGPDENEPRNQRPKRLRHHIVAMGEIVKMEFNGLSMVKIEEKEGVKYFKFVHEAKYEGMLRKLLLKLRIFGVEPLEELRVDTLEQCLQLTDVYLQAERFDLATKLIESALTFMQSIFAPSFNYTDGKTRLEYAHVENRPFHILLLKQLHMLSNKVCHRTALEIAKLMLNLDPSDPLGVILIVDMMAVRAREYAWILAIYEQWETERDGRRLFHLLYSRALAKYQVYLKSKLSEDLEVASAYLKEAMIKYPGTTSSLLQRCGRDVKPFEDKDFQKVANLTFPELSNLANMYSAFVWSRWNEEKEIVRWVYNMFQELCDQYTQDASLREEVSNATSERWSLFKRYPLQIKRHLSVIAPMSHLLIDGAVPSVEGTIPFNPYPEEGDCIDVHGYYSRPSEERGGQDGYLRSFLASLMPAPGEADEYHE